ncbi:hypothetical protein DYB32_000120 [Aphanomyces invadans]|uniref:Protein kinase domain-containing protein n=1 Tax=Aphanomyces invadans TaxID=157072 RepID=A0A418BAY1_9STRA|nr:hypothetical protein DYB32_000120 [Aphanomyces invadans]
MESPPVPKVAIDVESMKNNILKALAAAKSLAASKIAAPVAPDADIEPQVEAIESRHDDDTTGVLELRKSAKPKASSSSTDALSTQEISDEQHGAETSEAVSASISPAHDDQGSTIQKAVSPKRSPAVAPKPVPTVDQTVEFDMFALDDNDEDDGRVSDSDSYREKSSLRPAVLALERHGNHDDSEGYYKANIGEVLNGEYRVMGTVCMPPFCVLPCVLLCKQMKDDTTVAVKLIRNNDTMRDAAQLEVRLLTELQTGPRRSKYVVRLLNSFEFRSHAAMVFEPMQMNVREAMKKFADDVDIKPDNMLLDDKQSMVKLCDFGSAFKVGVGEVNDPTPYLVSRYYRAPEVILGLPYDFAVDMWSLGCCLYEMFTGKVMFPGQTNNEMLKLFMELKGRFPTKLMRRHRQVYQEKFLMEPHFDDGLRFCSREIDRVTGMITVNME